ncbi:MAG: hypothetical protein EA361_14890 [Bacteroidetes bacterium]|nr:MAG: hypothetical protein EA361_14890 [Bacteroidota bacterium]
MKNYKIIAKKGIALWVMTVILTFTLKACGKDKMEFPTGTITLTTAKSEVSFTLRIPIDARDLTIDWGDGKKSNISDASWDATIADNRGVHYTYEYSDNTEHTITITGQIMEFDCRNMQITHLDLSKIKTLKMLDCRNNKLTALDVSANTALNRLECDLNQLTSLDVSKNTSLSLLSCVGNQLSVNALNDLFRSLPHKRGLEYNEVGDIFISFRNFGPRDNPGVLDCDRNIAEEKGWFFRTLRQ